MSSYDEVFLLSRSVMSKHVSLITDDSETFFPDQLQASVQSIHKHNMIRERGVSKSKRLVK